MASRVRQGGSIMTDRVVAGFAAGAANNVSGTVRAEEPWTVARCMGWTEGYLKKHDEERPRLSAEWLMSAATGLSRIELYMNHDRPMSKDELSFMHQAVIRRSKGEPLQYITGETGFRMLDVTCEPGVLIPRPETELLVDAVLEYLDREVLPANDARHGRRERVELPWNEAVERAREAELAAARERAAEEAEAGSVEDAPAATEDRSLVRDDAPDDGEEPVTGALMTPGAEADEVLESEAAAGENAAAGEGASAREARVLEVGCGTGCISLSLASERRDLVRCLATDIEPRAVDLARRNRERNGLTNQHAAFLLGDLVSPVPEKVRGTFDVLVSNPPYIPSAVVEGLSREVAGYEPALALDGGADGLDVFRRLLAVAPSMLRPGGLFACELFEESLEGAAALCREAGLVNVRVLQDLTRRPRFVLAQTPAR